MSTFDFPPWFGVLETVTGVAFVLFVGVTLPLYVAEIYVLLRFRRGVFKGMFFRIITVGAIADVISLVNIYVGAIFPSKGWFQWLYLAKGSPLGNIYLIVAWGIRTVQGMTMLFLAGNRMIAVFFPVAFRKVSSAQSTALVLGSQIGAGVIVGATLVPRRFYWGEISGGYYLYFEDITFRTEFFTTMGGIEGLTVLIIILLNVMVLVTFRRKYKAVSKTSASSQKSVGGGTVAYQRAVQEKQRQENNLTLLSVLTCIVEFVYFIFVMFAFVIFGDINLRLFYFFYNMLSSIYGGLPAWILIRFCRPIRVHLLHLLKIVAGVKNSNEPTEFRMSRRSQIQHVSHVNTS